jgi:hypothetical protein
MNSQTILQIHELKKYFGMVHLADRTQAAVFAWREGIMRRDS